MGLAATNFTWARGWHVSMHEYVDECQAVRLVHSVWVLDQDEGLHKEPQKYHIKIQKLAAVK